MISTGSPEISPPGDETLLVSAGQDLKLPCEVTGHPLPLVIWERNGLELTATKDLGQVLCMRYKKMKVLMNQVIMIYVKNLLL